MLYTITAGVLLIAILLSLAFMPKPEKKWVTSFLVFVLVVWSGFNSFTIVEPGNTAVPIVLGSVDVETSYSEGVNWVNPVATIKEYNTKRRIIDYGGENSMSVPSSDGVQLTVDATMTFRTNPAYIGLIIQKVGNSHIDQLVAPASRSAFRAASARFPWADAAIAKRLEFAASVKDEFQKALIGDLVANGFSEGDANKVYIVGKVQLRKVTPPEKITSAIAERLSAEERLKKQKALTDIATQEALRRTEEGNGIANLLNSALGQKVGTSYDPQAVKIVLSAIADKTRADAMEAAVESGKVSVMVMSGNSSVAVPAK